MKQQYELRVRKWRTNMSGCAWRVYHHDGRCVNWIEAPYPKTPISLAIFLHEVGHHAVGFKTYKMRCEEEYHVWVWAINEMVKLGVQPDERHGVLRVLAATMTEDPISKGKFVKQVLLDPNFRPEGAPVARVGDEIVGFCLALARQVPLENAPSDADRGYLTLFGVAPDF